MCDGPRGRNTLQTDRSRIFTALIAYALFLTVNATSIWGGVFPFIPRAFQTTLITQTFYFAQAVALCATFLILMLISYRHHRNAGSISVAWAVTPMFLGSSCLVAAMYLTDWMLAILVAGGVLLGIGAAVFFALLQTCFSAQPLNRSGLLIVLGTALASVFYLILHLVPGAVTAFLIPLILIPLCGLCLSLTKRSADLDQPMFEDAPHDHPRVYREIGHIYWKSAVCIGSLGFSSGIIRALALSNAVAGDAVNIISMVGSLIGALVLIGVWNRHSFDLSIYATYRLLIPFLITAFLLLPFLGTGYLNAFAGMTYMLYSLAFMLMMVHCIQISQDNGVDPVFLFSFFAAIVYLLQSAGFVFGLFSEQIRLVGLQPLSIVALGSVWFLAMVLVVCDKYPLRLRSPRGVHSMSIGFIALKHRSEQASLKGMREGRRTISPDARGADGHGRGGHVHTFDDESATSEQPVIRDRISKQCLLLKEHYSLTSREAEIMEYIARGTTVPKIAERLVISENTVRAHSKHIYTKLGIHKRQDLLDMLDTI